jgi:hypothetical protein
MITVSLIFTNYKNESFLLKNISLIKRMNPKFEGSILIINNDSDTDIRKLINDTNIEIIDNPEIHTSKKYINGSYHHAEAINFGLQQLDSDVAIIIDADFYVIYPDWINNVLEDMKHNNLSVFGAPFNPKHYTKWRYFPCAHFIAINLLKIEKNSLDFTPSLESYHILQNKLKKYFVPLVLWQFFIIGKSKDTGFFLYSKFKNEKYSSLIPVFKVSKTFFGKLKYFFSYIFPEQYSLFPKNKTSYTQRGFLSNENISDKGWEEYFWDEKPFALHFRTGGKITDFKKFEEMFNQLDKFSNY